MPILDESVEFQLLIWAHAYTGRFDEHAALTAECGRFGRRLDPGTLEDHWMTNHRLWDHHRHEVTGVIDRGDGRGYVPVPDHWCLPWVMEHLRRERLDDV